MVISGNQILERGLVRGGSPDSRRNASYDIRVGMILDSDGNDVSCGYILQPGGVVDVISKETLNLPKDVTGYAFIKTSLCDKGIFALNTGILDPGYKGAISSPLLNFGKMPYRICVNNVFLRLTFHEFLTGLFHQPLTISKDVYVENRKNLLVERFYSQFMAVSDIASIAAKKAFGSYQIFLTLGIPVAVGLIALFTYFSVYQANIDSVQTARENMILSNHSVDSLEDVILSIEQMRLQNGELQALRGEIARLNSEIASLKQRINSQ